MKRNTLSGLMSLAALLFSVLLSAQATLPKVTEISATVSSDSLNSYVRILSGVDPVKIGTTTYTITSRRPGTSTHPVARSYIRMKFESFGLPTTEQPFSGTNSGTNVYAVQVGKNPNQVYIICGHYDSVTSYAADDNATGVAAVIEAARILSKQMPEYTIVYAAWDQEENGLVGSKYYAQQAKAAGMDIRAVINLDMLGWDSNNDGLAEIHVQNYANSVALANALVSANSAYGIGLAPVIKYPGAPNSDHSSFWYQGYSAILLIEGYYANDFTPYYHKTTDRYSTLNLNYLYKMSNMAITTLAGFVMNDLYLMAGKVYEDEDALEDGVVDGTGTNLGEELFIHLIDGSGNVTASAVVGSDGSYTFPDVAGGSYTAQLTLVPASVGAPMPATLLPAGWAYTGEHRGAGAGDDGQPDGLLGIDVTGSTSIREVHFGVGEAISSLEGIFTYLNDEQTPLEGVTVTLGGAGTSYSTTTGADGRYTFEAVLPGTYTVVTSSAQDASGAINALDAAMVNAWQVGPQYAIEKVRFLAADVSGTGHRLDAGDAGRINAHFLSGETQGWDAPVGPWSFWKTGEEITTNGGGETLPVLVIPVNEQVVQDFYGVITGDFNLGADLSTAGTKAIADVHLKSATTMTASQALLAGAPVTTIPEVKGNAGETVVLPVTVTGFSQIGAVSLMITYDPAVLANPVFTNTSGAIPGMGVNTSTAGVVRISGFTSAEAGATLADQSTFFTLSFTYLGGTTEVAFSHPYTTSCQYGGSTPLYTPLLDAPKSTYFIDGGITPIDPPVMTCPTYDPVLVTAEPFALSGASPSGGTYSGTGVSQSGDSFLFDPATAGVGTHSITYSYNYGPSGQELVAYWSFNELNISGTTFPVNGDQPLNIAPTSGTGNLSLTGWGGGVTSLAGSILNVVNSDPAGNALSLSNFMNIVTGNNTYIQIQTSLLNLTDPVITFATNRNSAGYTTGTWSYSIDGINFIPWVGNTAPAGSNFELQTVDFSGVSELTNASTVYFRYTLNGSTAANGNNLIDNLQINATEVSNCIATCQFTITVTEEVLINCPDDFAVCQTDEEFELTGAIPAGGSYEGVGVSYTSPAYFFSPSGAGPGVHTITYYPDPLDQTRFCTFDITVEATPVPGTLTKSPDLLEVCEGLGVSATFTPGTGGNGIDELEYRTTADGTTWGDWASYISGTSIPSAGIGGVEIRTRRLAYGCLPSGYNTVAWTVNPLPTITITTSDYQCSGRTLANRDYSATTGDPNLYMLDWDDAANTEGFLDVSYTALPTNPQAIGLIIPEDAEPGIYYATLMVKNSTTGCESTGYTISLTLEAPPVFTVQPSPGSQNVCQNGPAENLTVTVTEGDNAIGTYEWFSNTSASTSGSTPVATHTSSLLTDTYTPVTTSAGTLYYYCVVTDAHGCQTWSEFASVTINANPSAPVSGGDQTICANETIPALTVTVGVGETADWYSLASGGTVLATATTSYTPTAAGTYYAQSRNTTTGCVSTSRTGVTLTINANPSAPVSGGDQTICANETIPALTVTVGVGETADWYSVASGGTALATATTSYTPTAAGTYYAQSRNTTTGCVSTSRTGVTLTINANPSAPVSGGDQTICANETIPALTVTVGVGETADWYAASSGGTALVTGTLSYTPTAAGTYYAEVRNTGTGCVSTTRTAVTLTINANPTAPSVGTITQPTCSTPTGSVILSGLPASGSWTLTRTPGGTTYTGSGTTYTVTGLPVSTTYTFTVTNSNNCVSTSSANVVIDAIPGAPVLGGATAVCAGLTANVTPATAGTWSSSNTAVATITDGGLVTGVSAGNVTLTYTRTADGCSNTMSFTVNANPSAPVSGGDQTICANETIPALTVTVGVGETADWYSVASGGTALATATTSYTPTAAGTYYAQSRNTTTGCVSTSRTGVTLTINANPSAPVSGGDQTICANETIPALTVTVGVGETADWYSVASGGTALATATTSYTPTAAGTYYAQSRNTTTGCVSTSRTGVTLTINANPSAPVSGGDQTICANETIPALTVTVGVGETADWYSLASGGTALATATTSYTPTAAGTYYAQSRNTTTGCVSTSRTGVTLTINANPSAPVSGGDQTICANETIPALTVTVGVGETADWYAASSGGTALVTGTLSYTPTAAGTYYAEVRNTGTGCVSTTRTAVTLTINANPTAPSVGTITQPTCSTPTGSVILSGLPASGSWTLTRTPGGTTYTGSGTTYTVTGLPVSTTYTFTVTNSNNCVSTSSANVVIDAIPGAPVLGGATAVCAGLTANVTPATAGTWSSSNTAVATITDGGLVTGVSAGNVTLTYTRTADGCSNTMSFTVNANPSAPVSGGDQTICANETIPALTVTVGVGETADWYSLASGGTALATATTSYTPTAAGTYYAQSRNTTTGCVSTSRTGVTLTINANPSAPVSGGDQTICANETIPALTVTVGVGETADWYSLASGGTALATATTSYTPTAAGTYYAQSRNTTTGCVSTSRTGVTLTINANPSAPVSGGDQTICANETIPALTVTVGVGETADWYSVASGGTALATATTSYTPTAAGTYYAQSRNTTTGCVSTSRTGVTLTINANPSAPVSGGDQTICANETIPALTVTVGVGETADWYSLASGGTALATATTSYTPTAAGTYYAQSRNTTTGCVSTSRTGVTLTINANPSAPVSGGDQTICANETIPALTVTVGVGETADWYSLASGGTALATATTSYTPTAAGTYYAQSRNTTTGCVSTSRTGVTLTINANPSAPVSGGDQTICANETIPALTVTVGVGETADWYSVASGGTALATATTSYTPTAAGTYYAQSRNTTTGCVSTSRTGVTLTINANPSAPVSGGDQTICANETIPALTVTVGVGETADWYSLASGGTALATATTSYTPTAAGTYYAQSRNTTTGCVSTSRTGVTLTINANPSAPVSGGDQTICANETIPALTVTVGVGETADWYSVASGGTALATATTSYTPTAAGTYYAQSRNTTTGCVSTSRTGVTLTINALPVVYAGADQTIPNGTSTTISDATATGTAPLTYAWTPAASFVDPGILHPTTVILKVNTTFTLTVTDANGCQSSDQVLVTVSGGPLSVSPVADPVALCLGESTTLSAQANGGSASYTYSWTSVPEGFVSTMANPAAVPEETTTYKVEVYDGYTAVSGEVTVTVNPLPDPLIFAGDMSSACPGETITLTAQSSLNFDGSSTRYVQVPNYSGLNVGNLTLEAWVYPTYYGGIRNVFFKGDHQYYLQIRNGYVYFGSRNAAGAPLEEFQGSMLLPLNQWSHIAVTHDGTLRRLYVNGIPDPVISGQAGLFTGDPNGAKIGAHFFDIPNENFNGIIDELRVWSVARSAEDLASNMHREVDAGSPGLAAYFRLNEGSGGTTFNLVSPTNSGVLVNDPEWVTPTDVPISYSYSWSTGETSQSIGVTSNDIYTLEVTDLFGCTASTSVEVALVDVEKPTISCPGEIALSVDVDKCTASGVALGIPTVNDNCTLPANAVTNNAPAEFLLGNTTVIWTVTDGAGLTATCSQLVTVTDNQKPTITCPSDPQNKSITSPLTAYTAVGTEFDATATDNCGTVTLTNSLNSLSTLAGYDFPVGTTTVTWYAADEAGNSMSCTFSVIVTLDNTAPVANNDTYTVEEDGSVILTPLANDTDADSDPLSIVSINGTALTGSAQTITVSNGTVNISSSGVITFIPSPDYFGTVTFPYMITDGVVNAAASISVTVTAVNDSPVLAAIGNKIVDELTTLTFTAMATDVDLPAENLTFSLIGAPAGATIDPTTGAFSWTPTEAQGPGTYTVTVKVCDNGTPSLCDEETITITVVEISCPEDFAVCQIDGEVELTGGTPAGGSYEGDGVSYTSPAYLFSPSGAGPGVHTITYYPDPEDQTRYCTFDITVEATPVPGTLTKSPDLNAVCEGTGVSATLTPGTGGNGTDELEYRTTADGTTWGDWASYISGTSIPSAGIGGVEIRTRRLADECDPSGYNSVAWTVVPNLPVSVAIAADPTGAICSGTSVTFTATPTNGGTTPAYQWKLNGVDVGTGAATYTNAALVNGDKVTCVLTSSETCTTGSPATSNEIAMTVNPNLPVSVAIAADPTGAICSGTSVTFTATPTNGGTTPAYQWKLNGVDVGTGAATYTNAALVNGDKVTCVLTSSETCTTGSPATSNEIAMTVNLMPELTSIAYAGSPFCSNEGTALVTLVGDAGGTYVSTPSGLSMNAATGALALATSIAGTYTVTYTIGATGGCPAVSASTQITINPLPTAFAGADKSIPYGTSVTLADATATGTAPLTYAWTPAASFVDPSILHPTTVILEANTTFTLTVTDANGCQSSDQVLVTVTGGPLSVSPVADPVALCLGESTTLSAQANGGSASYTYSWTSVPEGFTSISANPVVTPLVTTVYSVVVNDGFNSVSGTVTVTVNDLPVANVTGPLSIPYGTATAITTAIASGTEPLTYSWEPSALLVDPSVLNPVTKNIYSPTVFTLTVTDANGCSASSVISILMEPSLSPIGGQTVNELSDLEVTLSAYDTPGATTLTFSLVDAPEGMTIANTGIEGDKRTGLLSWTPTEAQGPGTYTITVQVCDDGTPPACDQETILITVGEVNAAPVLTSIGNKTVEELGMLTFTATATDGDVPADNLTFSLTGAPAGATIDPVTGAFNWSPTEAQGPGTYTITVQVCDDGTPPACDTETILITVTESTPLSVTLKADPILCNGGTTQVVVTAEGGVAPYSGTGNFLAEAGTHTYVVTDSEGNVATGTITLTEPEPLVAKATAGTIQCYGETTSVVVEATGGTLPYQGTGTFIVEGGIQEFLITDANGCTATVSVTVQAPSDPLFCMATVNQQESLTGAADGEAMVIADGGWGDYSYLWSNGQTTAVATGLTAGTYTVTVTDAQGCSSKCEVLMTIKPSIYGNVFHDFDRMTDNTVDGYGINPEGLLYVNLLDGSGIVLASQLVNVDGTFSFRSADAGNYTVQISVNGGVPGEAMPLTALPVNWIHTGEHQGAGPGSDGTADGLISIFVDGNSDLVQVNFGVVKLPDVTVTITASPNVMNGVTDFDVILKVTEVNGVNTNGSITVLIPKDLRWGLKNGFDQALTFLGGSHLDNNKWTFNGSDPDYLEFVCNEVLPGDHFITLGFKATFDPGATRGVYTITSQLSLGSGGENRYSNNSDSEKLDYFSK